MDKSQHLPLTFSVKNIFSDVKEGTKKATEMEVSADDAKLLDLTRHEGWTNYQEELERRIMSLKNFIDPEGNVLIDADGDPSLIGVKYLMVAFAVYQLRAVINIPQALVEYQRIHGQSEDEQSGEGI